MAMQCSGKKDKEESRVAFTSKETNTSGAQKEHAETLDVNRRFQCR
jgi:hypothetical protein